eukprot:Opistho-2@51719
MVEPHGRHRRRRGPGRRAARLHRRQAALLARAAGRLPGLRPRGDGRCPALSRCDRGPGAASTQCRCEDLRALGAREAHQEARLPPPDVHHLGQHPGLCRSGAAVRHPAGQASPGGWRLCRGRDPDHAAGAGQPAQALGCTAGPSGTAQEPGPASVSWPAGRASLSSGLLCRSPADDRTAAPDDLLLRDVEHAGSQQCDADRLGRELRLPRFHAADPGHQLRRCGPDLADLSGPGQPVRGLSAAARAAARGRHALPALPGLAADRRRRRGRGRGAAAHALCAGGDVPGGQSQDLDQVHHPGRGLHAHRPARAAGRAAGGRGGRDDRFPLQLAVGPVRRGDPGSADRCAQAPALQSADGRQPAAAGAQAAVLDCVRVLPRPPLLPVLDRPDRVAPARTDRRRPVAGRGAADVDTPAGGAVGREPADRGHGLRPPGGRRPYRFTRHGRFLRQRQPHRPARRGKPAGSR